VEVEVEEVEEAVEIEVAEEEVVLMQRSLKRLVALQSFLVQKLHSINMHFQEGYLGASYKCNITF